MKTKEVLFVSAVATLTILALDAAKQEWRYRRQKNFIRARFGIKR